MNIVIDARTLGWTGIGVYGRELIKNLAGIQPNHNITVVAPAKYAEFIRQTGFDFMPCDIALYSPAEQLQFPRLLSALKPDLVHFLNPSIPILYRGKHVTTIHDLTLIDYKNIRGSRAAYEVKFQVFKRIMRAAAHSNAVITDAEYVRHQIIDRYNIAPENVHAIPLATTPPQKIASGKRYLDGDYLLYVGNHYPYKNLMRLIEAMPSLLKHNPNLKLVIAGKVDTFTEEYQRRVSTLGLEDRVLFPGYISDQDLDSLYRHALLYVFPSLSEGFGLPPLEAMHYGVPVAAARASCIPEVLGSGAAYFDPLQTEDIAKTISDLLANPRQLKKLTELGHKHVATFSWNKTAEQTLGVYKDVLGR